MTPPPSTEPLPPPPAATAHGGRSFGSDIHRVLLHPFTAYLAATTAAVVVLFARAPRPYVVPQLFAEDGMWSSLVHTRGFLHAAFHGRPESDYTILGNILLLEAGKAWCHLVHGGDPLEYARSCALVSYVFVAAVVSLPVLLLRHRLPPPFLAALWLAGCVLPLGIHDRTFSGFEILGRVSNAGFVCLYAAFLLVWHRTTAAPRGARLAAVDLGLLACITTNPICAAVLPAAVWPQARAVWRGRRTAADVARDPAVVGLVLLAAAAAGLCGLPNPWKIRPREPVPPLDVAGIVEIALARSTLYPVLWPVYRHLGTGLVLAATVLVVALVARVSTPHRRMVYLGGGALLALVAAVLVVFRPELGTHLRGYDGTFPDRYFHGQNLVGVALLVTLAADVSRRALHRRWLRHVPLALVAAWIVAAVLHEPPWRLAPSQTLRPEGRLFALRAARAVTAGSFVDERFAPDPDGRFVLIPNPEGTPKKFVFPREPLIRALAARGYAVAGAANPRLPR